MTSRIYAKIFELERFTIRQQARNKGKVEGAHFVGPIVKVCAI